MPHCVQKDLDMKVVGLGSLGLIAIIAILPQVPGDSIIQKLLIGILVIVFGALFVTVSSYRWPDRLLE